MYVCLSLYGVWLCFVCTNLTIFILVVQTIEVPLPHGKCMHIHRSGL